MSAESSRFVQHLVKSGNDVLIEAILPGGSITGVFRNEKSRLIVIEGRLDKIEWTIYENSIETEHDILQLLIPDEYVFPQIGISLEADKGRILLRLPISIP